MKPELLKWARESSHASLSDAAHKAGISDAKTLEQAELGAASITFRQLERLAQYYCLPMQLLYLDNIPVEEPPPADFRSRSTAGFSTEVIQALRKARSRRDAALSLFDELKITREALPAFKQVDSKKILDLIRPLVCVPQWHPDMFERYGMGATGPRGLKGAKALSATKEILEARFSLLIFEAPIDTETFRGCSILHPKLPVILLSSKDSANGRRFTLVHELIHLLLREPGVCTPLATARTESVEKYCDSTAGEALVPSIDLCRLVSSSLKGESAKQMATIIAGRFLVSRAAAAVRLAQEQIIPRSILQKLLDDFNADWVNDRRKQADENEGGPNYHSLQVRRLGPTFTQVVLDGLAREILPITEAAQLLGVRPSYKSVEGIRKQMQSAYGF